MILYLDTSTSFLYSALYDETVVDSISLNLGKELSANSLSLVNDMLKRNNLEMKDLKKIIVVNGPGSFTGVRVGLTIAKMIAWSNEIPIITISSLEAMALSSPEEYDFVAPLIDARRGYCYGGIFDKVNKQFILKEQYLSYELILASLNSITAKNAIITNDEFKSDYDTLKYQPNYKIIIDSVKDREPTMVHLVDANYLKKTEAEENKNDK